MIRTTFFFLFVGLWLPCLLYGQNQTELKNKRQKLIEEIEMTSKRIQANKKESSSAAKSLQLINAQLRKRRSLLEVMESEQVALKERNEQIQDSITELTALVAAQEADYGRVLNSAHIRSRMKHPFSGLISGGGLFSNFKRWIYLNQLNNYVDQKWEGLKATLGTLDRQKQELQTNIAEQDQLLEQSKSEEEAIEKKMVDKKAYVQKLKANKRALERDLKKKEKERLAINQRIEKLILAELSKKKASTGVKRERNMKLAKEFAGNKGNLPWPVEKGVITGRFGKRAHPDLKGVYTNNSGVDILTDNGAAVFAVFDGLVVGNTTLPGGDKMIVLSHGNFFTVYSKLESTSVQMEQTITRGTPIGKVGKTSGELHFEVWEGKQKRNPQLWLGN